MLKCKSEMRMRLSQDVTEEILLRFGLKELLLASQVSSSWNSIIKSKQFLRRKLKYEKIGLPQSVWNDNFDLKFYLSFLKNQLVPFEKNLLRNSSGEEEEDNSPQLTQGNRTLDLEDFDEHWFRGWYVYSSGGWGWKLMEQEGRRCFVTAQISCTKQQVINLEDNGISGWILDTYKPDISFEEHYSTSSGYGGCYECKVSLQNAKGQVIDHRSWRDDIAAEVNSCWKRFKGRFADYPEGVRSIVFYHGGFGDYEHEGWWGTRMTGATVSVSFPKSNPIK